MIIFYAPCLSTCSELPEEESGHVVRVLRHTVGDEIDVVDGNGMWYHCRIASANPKHCSVEILSSHSDSHWPYRVELAIGPTKNLDRMEWWLEKSVEIGLDRFVPLRCRFSERKELKTERLRKIAIAAMKQSLKATLPQIDEMTDFKRFIEEPFDGQKFIAHCMDNQPRHLLSHLVQKGRDVRILIGPEGDFSQDEVSFALQNGYLPISLGDQRLRTETAALVSVHTVHLINSIN
jgi:16S rRNA (uracil1498-N3)-methyltransferase